MEVGKELYIYCAFDSGLNLSLMNIFKHIKYKVLHVTKSYMFFHKISGYVYLIHSPYCEFAGSVPKNVYKIGQTTRSVNKRMYEQFRTHRDEVKKIHVEEVDINFVHPETIEYKCLCKFNKYFEKWEGKEWFIINDIEKAVNIIKSVSKKQQKLGEKKLDKYLANILLTEARIKVKKANVLTLAKLLRKGLINNYP